MNKKIIIIIKKGMVWSVLSSFAGLDVLVVDRDNNDYYDTDEDVEYEVEEIRSFAKGAIFSEIEHEEIGSSVELTEAIKIERDKNKIKL